MIKSRPYRMEFSRRGNNHRVARGVSAHGRRILAQLHAENGCKENRNDNDGNKSENEAEAHGSIGRWGRRPRAASATWAMQDEDTEGIGSVKIRNAFERFAPRESTYCKEN